MVLTARRLDGGGDVGVVDRQEPLVVDLRPDLDALARRHEVRADLDLDRLRHVAHQPAQELAPEGLVGLVLDRDVGVHLPVPGVVHAPGQRLAAAVALVGEDHLLSGKALALADQQAGRARLDLGQGIEGRQLRQPLPDLERGLLGRSELERRVTLSPGGRLDRHLGEERLALARASAPSRRQDHRQHLRHRRPAPAPFAERAAAAEHHEAAAALGDELGDQAQLIVREEARLDRSQDEPVVAEELLALGRETAVELARLVELESREAVLGGALEHDQLQVLVAAAPRGAGT